MTVDDDDNRRQFSDEELLQAVTDHSPASTSEIAEVVGATRRAVDYRLKTLEEEDTIQSKKIGQSLVWFTECR